MIPRNDEPMEGVVFDVQDHARRTGTRGLVRIGRWLSRTSMGLKSPSDGCWDGRDKTTLWWAIAREERRKFHQDTLAEPDLGGITHFKWNVFLLMERMSPRRVGCYLERVAVCWGHLARVASWRSPRRANVWFMDVVFAQKGPTSPSKRLDVPLFAHIMTFL